MAALQTGNYLQGPYAVRQRHKRSATEDGKVDRDTSMVDATMADFFEVNREVTVEVRVV